MKWNKHTDEMKWKKHTDEMLIREILTQKPWEYRSKSQERGQVWDNIVHVLYLYTISNQHIVRPQFC